MKWSYSLGLMALAALFPALTWAQNTVALFAPNLDFKDGAQRNTYVTKVAKALSDATGMKWSGQAFARASDFEAARASIDVAILDADYFTAKGGALKPVAMLTSNGQTMRPLKVIVKKGGSDKLYDYRQKRLAIVANTSMAASFVTASLLGNEIKANEYFSSVDEVRDVRSALNALEVGKADLTMVYDGYDAGFSTIYTSPAVALPVIVVNAARLTGEKAENVKKALLNIPVHASSFITGTTGFSAQDAGAYRRVSATKKTATLSYQPIENENVRVDYRSSSLKNRQDGIAFNPFQVQYVPSLEAFDKVLERNI